MIYNLMLLKQAKRIMALKNHRIKSKFWLQLCGIQK